ncbi:MAG: RagB/SusD family nutrient uptake outer membrane protein [Oscillibacter sp.]|nr:RagB/SusD family nutrient uptake outer membrane protein [Oscillibacter sp.]
MKTKIKHSWFLFLLIFCSCNSWIDITPSDRLSENMLFENRQGFEKAINGIYVGLVDRALYGRTLSAGTIDFMAQYYTYGSGSDMNSMLGAYRYEEDEIKAIFQSAWEKAYALIVNCNIIIEKCETEREVLSDVYYGLYKGEATALRAMLHLDVLRLFGPVYDEASKTTECIPYVTNSNTEISPLLSVEEILSLVIRDLNTALDLLKSSDPILSEGVRNESNTVGGDNSLYYRQYRMNYYAVKALLARAYAWGHDDKSALIVAEEILNEVQVEDAEIFPFVKHSVAVDPSVPDRVFSSEVMFSLYDSYRGTEIQDKLFVPTVEQLYTFSTKRLEMGKEYSFYASENDYRYAIWAKYSNAGAEINYHRKYEDVSGSNAVKFNKMVPLIRLSEIILLAAECSDNFETAKGYLDKVRNNRNCPSSTVTETTLMDEITKECRREFLGEGQMFFFYKRKAMQKIPNGKWEKDSESQTINMNMSNYVVPLPDSEINMRLN